MTKYSPSPVKGRLLKGVFHDSPVEGLEYATRTVSGMTNEKGEFKYRAGETVTFSIGGLVLGTARGNKRVTPADLVIEASGDIKRLKIKKVTNIARFLQSLDEDSNVENGITITDATRNIVRRYRYSIDFSKSEDDFTADENVKALFAELKRPLRSAAHSRNQLRHTLMGITKMTDVKIPTRDGSYLMSDIYLPLEEGRYPAIVSLGGHGKVLLGTMGLPYSNRPENLLKHEIREDKFFEGNQENVPYVENHGAANMVDWVPQGYVCIKIDERGVGYTPGLTENFSLQSARDYYDAIEWAARQPWCNGKVGTWGFSYWAMTQWGMLQLQPPSLKAAVPIFGCTDSYREMLYHGGIWFKVAHTTKNKGEGEWKGVDWAEVGLANSFDDPALYGPEGSSIISADLSKITVPLWSAMPLEYFDINIRGSSEGYIHASSRHKKFTIAGDYWGAWPYSREAFVGFKAFFDYWLKGVKNDIMDEPPVKMMVRTGGGGYFWQTENEWPIARTKYKKYYLDASPSSLKSDGMRKDFLRLAGDVPKEEKKKTYSAEVNLGVEAPPPPGGLPQLVGGDPPWSHGVSFVTEPLTEDVTLAGYVKLGMWVSSTSTDMDIVASLRVVDENDTDVPYAMTYSYGGRYHPITIGWLRASHRKLDPEKSTVYRPYHTHKKNDYQSLKPSEVVEVEVEIWPTTAFVRKGHRIRLDVQPSDGHGHPAKHVYDETYHKGAANTIYTGPEHPSYLQLPVIPAKEKQR